MNDFKRLLARYRTKGILVDTNMMLLLIIGDVDPRYVEKWPRTSHYRIAGYQALDQVVRSFARIVTTPNILTEVSNFATKDLHGDRRSQFFERFAEIIPTFLESYVESQVSCGSANFLDFGLADLSILGAVKNEYAVLTDDGRLESYLGRSGINVLSFATIQALHQQP